MEIEYMCTAVFVMALVSYLPRVLPILFINKPIKSNFVKSFLYYVPYAVIAAMIFPDILFTKAGFIPSLVGFVSASSLSFFGIGLLPTALIATFLVYMTTFLQFGA